MEAAVNIPGTAPEPLTGLVIVMLNVLMISSSSMARLTLMVGVVQAAALVRVNMDLVAARWIFGRVIPSLRHSLDLELDLDLDLELDLELRLSGNHAPCVYS